ncbi:MAG: hypothetical protein ACRCTS_01235 [Fusobacteriaceae bacterium]
METLISGLDYFPESSTGIESLKKQYGDFRHSINLLSNSTFFSLEDIKELESHLIIVGQINNLSKKLPSLNLILPDIPKEKNKFSNALNIYLKNTPISNSRKENIFLLVNYKNFLKFSDSPTLKNRIAALNFAVTIKYASTLKVQSNQTRYDLHYLFKKISHENSHSHTKDYIQFLGNLESLNNISKDIQVVQIEISSIHISSEKGSELSIKSDKSSQIFKQNKTLLIRGTYKLFNSQSRFPLFGTELNIFEFKKDFSLEIEKSGNSIKKIDEKKVMEKLFEEFFYEILEYEIPYELNNYFK